MKPLLLMLCLCAWISPLQAAIEAYEFDSPQMEADYNKLIGELRCLVCQNQNLSGSDADLAQDLRRETYQMLSQGKSPQQVVDFCNLILPGGLPAFEAVQGNIQVKVK